jgi:urea carboxylase system permease
MTEPAAVHDPDAHDLASFGYAQQLKRGLGSFAAFAAGFSFISILTTVFQLFFLGFSFGGAAFFWTWPIVFAGQLMVALCFAELAARYPISGCIYQWAKRLTNPTYGFFAGWVMVIGQVVTVAAAAIALQVVLPQVWDGFQLVGSDPTLTSSDGATNAVILGAILVIATTIVNAIGVKAMARINSAGVVLELIGIVVLIVVLLFNSERGPGAVLHQTGAAPGQGYLAAFIVSALMAAYVMVGFDSAGELSEETSDPRSNAPKAIIRALVVAGLAGGVLVLVGIMAAPSLTDGKLGTLGLPYVILDQLGNTGGKIMLADVSIAVCVCTMAIQTAAMRMMYSMSRDGVMPFSGAIAKVNPTTGTPILSAVLIGVATIGLLLVNVGDASIFLNLTSVCIVMLYLAYLAVTVPMLRLRLKGAWPGPDPSGAARFSLGRWGLPVNLIAVAYGALMTINIGWPRATVYDLEGGHWYLQYFAPLFVVATLVVGACVFAAKRRTSTDPVGEVAAAKAQAA